MSPKLRKGLKISLFGILPLAILIFFVATGYHYVPVDVTIGSCLKDYTSPSTYTERSSPLKSYEIQSEDQTILICYGSPSVKGRKIFGDLVPYNRLWRFGANEPTRIYTSSDLVIGEVVVPKGRYSMYAIPGEESWEIFISESTFHWGNWISESVRDQEIGSFEVVPETNSNFVESFTISSEEDTLIIEWESTLLRIPIIYIDEG
ncbi:MAG: DUF2911 domain-containing protein [Balneolaceae bacterium]|nr:DUF2911 domain-containing protein [Balneolaceae bacterium]MBO6546717.1 DUF2911 domain-containing protein [Balneolaceae bacterium]MBO6649075.1 DUF2911 domain-containing protein [Balneolaceae bacterium]